MTLTKIQTPIINSKGEKLKKAPHDEDYFFDIRKVGKVLNSD
jgi:hypothetical protein